MKYIILILLIILSVVIYNFSYKSSYDNTDIIQNNTTERFAVSYGINLDTVKDKGALYNSKYKANSGTNFY